MLHFSKNLNCNRLNKRFKRAPFAVIILLFIQSFMPLVASANIRNLYQNSGLDEMIIICSGNELIYLMLNDDGKYTKIPPPTDIPKAVQTHHCDGCILPGVALPNADNTPYYVVLIANAKCPKIGALPQISFYNHRPPSRAPPA